MFRVIYGYTARGTYKAKRFATLAKAERWAQAFFERTGVVLGIEAVA